VVVLEMLTLWSVYVKVGCGVGARVVGGRTGGGTGCRGVGAATEKHELGGFADKEQIVWSIQSLAAEIRAYTPVKQMAK
jgi:hypothetical protein